MLDINFMLRIFLLIIYDLCDKLDLIKHIILYLNIVFNRLVVFNTIYQLL